MNDYMEEIQDLESLGVYVFILNKIINKDIIISKNKLVDLISKKFFVKRSVIASCIKYLMTLDFGLEKSIKEL